MLKVVDFGPSYGGNSQFHTDIHAGHLLTSRSMGLSFPA